MSQAIRWSVRPNAVRRAGAFATMALALALAGCSRLDAFDTLVPHDAGATRLADSIPYGASPRQTLAVYRPRAASGPAPVVVFVYGGSWNSGNKEDYSFIGDTFAAAGYVTVIPDYRLVPGVRYPDFLRDLAQSARWVQDNIARFGGDARQIVLVGHSAGAYNAAMLVLDPAFLQAAGVDRSRLNAFVGLAGPYDFLPSSDPDVIAAFGPHPDRRTQPVTFARRDTPPTFLAAGTDDTTVRPANTQALAARLRAAGAPVTEKYYPGTGHVGLLLDLSRPFRGRQPVLADVTAFVNAHLRNPAADAAGPR